MQLYHQRDQLEGLNVVVITFGSAYWGQVWRQETNVDFPILRDVDRQVYQAYGFEQSLSKTWNLPTLIYYAGKALKGQFSKIWRGDVNQMGGDVVVDEQGRVQFIYRSQNPPDRPSLEQIQSALG